MADRGLLLLAKLAMESGALLLHRDHDFQIIARLFPLSEEFFRSGSGSGPE